MSTSSGWLMAKATARANESAGIWLALIPMRPQPGARASFGNSCRVSASALRARPPSDPVLFVADLFHPVDDLAVERFLNGDMRHGRGGVAPCQCFSPGANQTTSPGRISSTGPPSRWTQPQPAVTISVCPSGCVCHAVRAPGSNVTLAPRTRAGSGGWNSGSTRTSR